MLDLVPMVFDEHGCLIVSVSSFLIMLHMVLLQLRPLVGNASSASRGICSAPRPAVRLLARDGGGVAPPRQARRRCERCARRGASRSDIAAVVTSLGMPSGGEEDDVNDAKAGCEAMWAEVDDLLESKVASEAELREAFYVFDRDEDGFVGAGELWNVMRRLGMAEGARHEDCRRMIAAHDGDGDGRISFREFRAMMENAV
ncbi:hypothetical protein BAE44_0018070 [Dichanthelium oligosanthes]|uniref:EF-hand domain-containing protein n=1 Tax=Dichanthelium oligosanthes TaxID=888268 RepID=A0A1E5V6X7_9POAL|nr:hypothetical protein BAE44_0018070 [Dichanthelium oligosanthes]